MPAPTGKTARPPVTIAVRMVIAPDGRFEGESVSGDFTVDFRGSPPPAEYNVETFSGSIVNCFGPKAQEEEYGPGARLTFREGAGTGRVDIDTKSGDVRICAR